MVPNRHADAAPNYLTMITRPTATFRRRMPGSEWSMDADQGDARLTPSGDHARRGTIPHYMPYAVLNPAHITNIPQ